MGKASTFNVGDKVFAKVKGYPPWPANVVGDGKNKKYSVVFYGTKETGNIKGEDICYFNQNRDSFVPKYQKRAGYEDAVKEIEAAIKKQGGDGSEKNPDAPAGKANDSKLNDSVVSVASDLENSQTEKSQKTPVAEKKIVKRKVQSLPDGGQKHPGRPRKSLAVAEKDSSQTEKEKSESPVEETEEPAPKKTRKAISVPEEKGDQSEEKPEEPAPKRGRGKSASTEESDKPKDDDTTVEENGVSHENDEEEKSKNEGKKNKKATKTKADSKRDEVVHMETDDEPLSIAESAETPKKSTKQSEKYELVSETFLKYNIAYAEHVSEFSSFFEGRPVEERDDTENDVLPVELPSGIVCGLKLHRHWPLDYSNEVDRAAYDKKVAQSVLALKDQILTNQTKIDDHPDSVIPNLHITAADVKAILQKRTIEEAKIKAERLKTESNLVLLDGKIKNSLGLDNADPTKALENLKQFDKVKIDAVMMKKHPHIMDTIRRLRKYVGNIKDWKLSDKELDEFNQKAKKIRNEAEKVYTRLKQKIVVVPANKPTFWEGFLELVSQFRQECTTMNISEKEMSMMCAEPSSRKAFLDRQEYAEKD